MRTEISLVTFPAQHHCGEIYAMQKLVNNFSVHAPFFLFSRALFQQTYRQPERFLHFQQRSAADTIDFFVLQQIASGFGES